VCNKTPNGFGSAVEIAKVINFDLPRNIKEYTGCGKLTSFFI
jgi:hypothetical protein